MKIMEELEEIYRNPKFYRQPTDQSIKDFAEIGTRNYEKLHNFLQKEYKTDITSLRSRTSPARVQYLAENIDNMDHSKLKREMDVYFPSISDLHNYLGSRGISQDILDGLDKKNLEELRNHFQTNNIEAIRFMLDLYRDGQLDQYWSRELP